MFVRGAQWKQSTNQYLRRFAPLLQKKATVEDPSRVIVTASIAGLGVGSLGENATFGYSASKGNPPRFLQPSSNSHTLTTRSRCYPSNPQPRRRARPPPHPLQQHRPGLLPLQNGVRLNGATRRRRTDGEAKSQRETGYARGYCRYGCVSV